MKYNNITRPHPCLPLVPLVVAASHLALAPHRFEFQRLGYSLQTVNEWLKRTTQSSQ